MSRMNKFVLIIFTMFAAIIVGFFQCLKKQCLFNKNQKIL